MRLFDRPELTPETLAAIELAREHNRNWMAPMRFRHRADPNQVVLPRRLVNTRWLRVRWETEPIMTRGRVCVRIWIGKLEIVWNPISKRDWK